MSDIYLETRDQYGNLISEKVDTSQRSSGGGEGPVYDSNKEITGTLTVGEQIISDFVPTVDGVTFAVNSNLHLGDPYDGGNGNGYPTHLTINAPVPTGDEDEWQLFEMQVNGESMFWLQADGSMRLKGAASFDTGVVTGNLNADVIFTGGTITAANTPATDPAVAGRFFSMDAAGLAAALAAGARYLLISDGP